MTALYTQYRPKTFAEVVGQDYIVTTLSNSATSGKLSHAYLLSGPRGCGKTTTARLIAKAASCKKKLPCGVCDSCKQIADDSHPDVIEIDAASNRGIEFIRSLRERVLSVPMVSDYKVYIIDEAAMLTREASNALLKTLEEPPPHIIFVLATTELEKMLPTIKSRCQIFNFRLIPEKVIAERLRQVCLDAKMEIPEETITLVAEAAKGSMRDALSLVDVIYGLDNMDADSVRRLLGRPHYQQVGDFVSCLEERNVKKSLTFIGQLYATAEVDMYTFRDEVAAWLRGLLFVVAGAEFSHPMLDRMKSQSYGFDEGNLLSCLRSFTRRESFPVLPQLALELPAVEAIGNLGIAEDF